ncbi:MAG TPA: response regulator [Pyrinomonadaceae bacterium]|jgi:two-component system chemotaxis sensor kinase CheA
MDIATPDAVAELPRPLTDGEPALAKSTRARILVAEDDRAIRRYLQVILERAGYEVVAAVDGLEAMKAALSSPVDAVVTDAIMPHLGGEQLCRFLRQHPQLSTLPIVLLSGVREATATTATPHARESADAYLSKPVRPEELTSCLARLLAA